MKDALIMILLIFVLFALAVFGIRHFVKRTYETPEETNIEAKYKTQMDQKRRTADIKLRHDDVMRRQKQLMDDYRRRTR